MSIYLYTTFIGVFFISIIFILCEALSARKQTELYKIISISFIYLHVCLFRLRSSRSQRKSQSDRARTVTIL